MRKWPLVLFALSFSYNAFALQIRSVVDNETTTAKISSVDVTRIFVQGDRIRSVKGVKGAYTRENDEANGEIYIQPSTDYQFRAFTILIDTEAGRHFTLLLNPVSVPSETLMLVPKGVGTQRALQFEQASPYDLTIKNLIKSMKLGEVPSGYSVTGVNDKKVYQFGNYFKVSLKSVYQGLHLRGEIYEVKSISTSPIQIDERQFYKSGARAISLDTIVIQPKSTINLYEVLSHD